MKVLVTGGAGYIGSHVVHMLIDAGYEVVVFDNFVTGYRDAIHPQAELVIGDLMNPADIEKAFQAHQLEGIFHFASYIVVPESMEKPWMYLRDNTVASANLLEVAVRHNVKRFILSSTAALFGTPETMPIPANEVINPGSPYGESKAMVERQLHWMDEIYGLKSCALRYFNAAGAHPKGHIGESHAVETHLIPLILQVPLAQREKIFIYGTDYPTPDGTAIRDYIHVMDLASAHILAFEALVRDNKSLKYNLGNGTGYSVREVIDVARQITEHEIPAVETERRAGDLAELVADSTAISQELGWEPKYSLKEIVATAWQWHKEHPKGFRQRPPDESGGLELPSPC